MSTITSLQSFSTDQEFQNHPFYNLVKSGLNLVSLDRTIYRFRHNMNANDGDWGEIVIKNEQEVTPLIKAKVKQFREDFDAVITRLRIEELDLDLEETLEAAEELFRWEKSLNDQSISPIFSSAGASDSQISQLSDLMKTCLGALERFEEVKKDSEMNPDFSQEAVNLSDEIETLFFNFYASYRDTSELERLCRITKCMFDTISPLWQLEHSLS